MPETYYHRRPSIQNGLRVFKSTKDQANEDEVKSILERAWKCEIRTYGGTCESIDWYAIRGATISAFLELKSRDHPVNQYKTVYLNLRKWLALTLIEYGTGRPGLFVVRWTDGLRFIPVKQIDARPMKLGGCARRVKSATDIEPVIEVPIEMMSQVQERS